VFKLLELALAVLAVDGHVFNKYIGMLVGVKRCM
jgi:hypothetical protein